MDIYASTPNLSNLLGAFTAAELIVNAGGLEKLARLHPSSISQLGSKEIERGYIYNSALVQKCSPQLHKKITKVVAEKTALAARCDAYSSAPVLDAAMNFYERVQRIIILQEKRLMEKS